MLLELLLLATGATLLIALGLVFYTFVSSHLTWLSFNKRSRGLPLLSDRSLLCNHVISWAIRPNLCTELKRAHDQMGKTIGFLYNSRFAVSSVDLDLIKTIVVDEKGKHMDRIAVGLPMEEYEKSIMLAPVDEWRTLRRSFAPALKSNKFKTPNVIHEIERSIEKMLAFIETKLTAQSESHQFDTDELVHRYSLNLVFSCFYKQPDLINFDDNDCQWTQLMDNGFHDVQNSPIVHAAIIFPIIRPLIDWLSYHFHKQGIWRKAILRFVKLQTKLGIEARKHSQELQARMQNGDKVNLDNFVLKDGTKFSRNMIDQIIDQFLDGKLTKDQYINSSCFLVAAADKTAADCIVFTLYQLGHNPHIQDRLRESIRDDGVDSEYLNWVLNESLRLMPPASLGCSRTVTRDIEIEGGRYVVPKGTFVITPSFTIHRLKEYWGEDAEEFKPERWADTSHHHPMQYLPFGAGPRGCPGKEFALFEMRMLLAALLTRYTFECSLKEDLYTFDSPFFLFVIPNSPTYMTIKRLST